MHWRLLEQLRIAAAFDLRPEVAELVGALVHAPRWHLFMSFDGQTCLGTGGLFAERNRESGRSSAYLDLGATDPRHRGRGGQAAVLFARIQQALRQNLRPQAFT